MRAEQPNRREGGWARAEAWMPPAAEFPDYRRLGPAAADHLIAREDTTNRHRRGRAYGSVTTRCAEHGGCWLPVEQADKAASQRGASVWLWLVATPAFGDKPCRPALQKGLTGGGTSVLGMNAAHLDDLRNYAMATPAGSETPPLTSPPQWRIARAQALKNAVSHFTNQPAGPDQCCQLVRTAIRPPFSRCGPEDNGRWLLQSGEDIMRLTLRCRCSILPGAVHCLRRC